MLPEQVVVLKRFMNRCKHHMNDVPEDEYSVDVDMAPFESFQLDIQQNLINPTANLLDMVHAPEYLPSKHMLTRSIYRSTNA